MEQENGLGEEGCGRGRGVTWVSKDRWLFTKKSSKLGTLWWGGCNSDPTNALGIVY